jgi:hypothetical protein
MAGSWTQLSNLPEFEISMALLLTDGSVLCQVNQQNQWRRLVPDPRGGYSRGVWVRCSDSPHAPLDYASAVLADGTVFIAGGEYDFGSEDVVDLLAAALYDPVADIWTALATPWYWTKIGDAPCCVLSDGTVLVGSIEFNTCTVYDPTSRSWFAAGSKLNTNSNEETWTLLPDGSVLSIDCNGHPATERYVNGAWRHEPNTPADLVEASSNEVGPAILLPSGNIFAIGATGATAIYVPDRESAKPGTWLPGPTFPKDANGSQLGAKDAPACLLPNGRVLCAVGPVDGIADHYNGPTTFFEYDPSRSNSDALTQHPVQPRNNNKAPSNGILLLLPSAEVLFFNGTSDVWIYAPDGKSEPQWAPTITDVATELELGGTYALQGTQLNGLSQACSYGDDAAMATNYPLVRLSSTSPKSIRYCRTFGHSTMGVATGLTAIVTTNFKISIDIPVGKYQLSVVANGIASSEVAVKVGEAATTSPNA